jgi:hypothetical protein
MKSECELYVISVSIVYLFGYTIQRSPMECTVDQMLLQINRKCRVPPKCGVRSKEPGKDHNTITGSIQIYSKVNCNVKRILCTGFYACRLSADRRFVCVCKRVQKRSINATTDSILITHHG